MKSLLIVKVGGSGYVPDPNEQRNIRDQFEAALKKAERDDVVVVVPYYVEVEQHPRPQAYNSYLVPPKLPLLFESLATPTGHFDGYAVDPYNVMSTTTIPIK